LTLELPQKNHLLTALIVPTRRIVLNITKTELHDILLRCLATTSGPWKFYVEGPDHTVGSSFIQTAGNDIELTGASINDQDFIASANQDIPRLISVIANLKGWVL